MSKSIVTIETSSDILTYELNEYELHEFHMQLKNLQFVTLRPNEGEFVLINTDHIAMITLVNK